MFKMHVMLVILAVVATTLALDLNTLINTSGSAKSEYVNIKLLFYDSGKSLYMPVKPSDLVDSFIKQNGSNYELTINGKQLEKGKKWANYNVKRGTTLIIKRGKVDDDGPPSK